MKKTLLSLTLGIILITGVGWECSAAPETVVLKQAIYAPAGHPYTMDAIEFGDWVSKATGGRVKIEVYPAASLCPANQEMTAVHNGSIDMSKTVPMYITGQFPLLNYTALPWSTPTAIEAAAKVNAEIVPILENSIRAYNVRIIMFTYVPNTYVLVTKKAIRTPAEMKGLKVRTPGGLTDKYAVNWGAAPVSLPAGEVYTSLQRGIVDATIITVPSVKGLRLNEVAPYVTDLNIGLSGFVNFVNKDKWNKISSADQKAIMDLTPQYTTHQTEIENKVFEKGRAEWAGLGVKVYVPNAAEMELWKAGAKPLWDWYAKSNPEAKKIVDILLKLGAGVK